MSTNNYEAIINVLRNRRSTRRFGKEVVTEKMIAEIVEDASWAPSGGNSQPWKITALGPDSVIEFLQKFQMNAIDLMLPAVKAGFEKTPPEIPLKEGFNLNRFSASVADEELNFIEAPPSYILFIHFDKPCVTEKIVQHLSGLSIVMHRFRSKPGVGPKLRYLWRALQASRRLGKIAKRMHICGLSNFVYAITLSAAARNIDSCILGMFSVEKKIRTYLGLDHNQEILASIILGSGENRQNQSQNLFIKGTERKPVPINWRL